MIWGATIPDVHYATVRMYPPGDNGQWEMEDIPITQAVQDDHWLFYTFPMVFTTENHY